MRRHGQLEEVQEQGLREAVLEDIRRRKTNEPKDPVDLKRAEREREDMRIEAAMREAAKEGGGRNP